MIWFPTNRRRQEWIRRVRNEGLQVAGFKEPGQVGWEELPIPKLDDGEDTAPKGDDEE